MEQRKVRIWVVGVAGLALLVAALLVVAWIMGGTQPTQWIEIPVQATGAAK